MRRPGSDRPQGYGVHVIQGAFTLWNMQPEASVILSADLAGLSAGRNGAPVLGGGIFVSGAGGKGGRLIVRRGIETFGGTSQSLVKGVVITLSAIGFSVKPGGSAREIDISGGIRTNGAGVPPIEQHGAIDLFRIAGGCRGAGERSRSARSPGCRSCSA